MKFLITMNMPSYKGGAIHQIICEYPAAGLADFCDALEKREFTIVEEFYKKSDSANTFDSYYESQGLTAVNYRYVGKIKEMAHRANKNTNIKYGDGHEQDLRKNNF
jgi:hypothetical protein